MRLTPRRIAAALVAVVLVGALGFGVGRITTATVPTPTTTSAAAGFARDMMVHHDQGVELSFLVRDRSDSDDIRLLAYDIATTQTNQSGQLAGWLTVWGLPQASPEPSMTWMTRPALDGSTHGHDGDAESAHQPGEPMPGLATPEQLQSLRDADGVEAERIFLELMIAHHKGAVEMAEALLDRSTERVAVAFSTSVIASQVKEITYMEQLLAERS